MGLIGTEIYFEGSIPFFKDLVVVDSEHYDEYDRKIVKSKKFNLSFNALYSSKLSFEDRSILVIGLKNHFLKYCTPAYIEATSKLATILPEDKFSTCIEVRGHYSKLNWDLENYVFWYRKAITDLLCSGSIQKIQYFKSNLKDDISQIVMNTTQIINDIDGTENTLKFSLVKVNHPQVPII